MVLKILFAAVGLLEVSSDRRPVDGGALLQLNVGLEKMQDQNRQKGSRPWRGCNEADMATLVGAVQEALKEHDYAEKKDYADEHHVFNDVVVVSEKIEYAFEIIHQLIKEYHSSMERVEVRCPSDRVFWDNSVCGVYGILEASDQHFEPTYGNSPLAVCKDWDGHRLSLWSKTVDAQPREPRGPPRKPEKPDAQDPCETAWDELKYYASAVDGQIHQLTWLIVEHGYALKRAKDRRELDQMTREQLKNVCPVGEMMAWIRGVFGVENVQDENTQNQNMAECRNVDTEDLGVRIGKAIQMHDHGQRFDAGKENAAIDNLVLASGKIEIAVKLIGGSIDVYNSEMEKAAVSCPPPSTVLDHSVCSVYAFLNDDHFEVEPTYGNSPLAVCKDWGGPRLSLWSKPRAPSGPPRTPSGPPRTPNGPPRTPNGPPGKPGGDAPTDTPEDCQTVWHGISRVAEDIMRQIHELEDGILEHGMYLWLANDRQELDGMTPEQLSKLCPVGEIMSWLRGAFGLPLE